MIRALIADDEPLSLRVLQQLLARHADVSVVAECADGGAVRDAAASHRPDVMFLDIQMPIVSGLDLARETREAGEVRAGAKPLIVFVTAFHEFALPAFDVEAVDYLMKPLVEQRFDAALDRVRDRLAGRTTYRSHLVARHRAREVLIPVESIDYIEADDVYAAVVAGSRRHLVRASLDTLEQELDPAAFVRVHRSYIVHIDRVAEVRRDAGPNVELRLRSGAVVPVSRRRQAALARTIKSPSRAPFAT